MTKTTPGTELTADRRVAVMTGAVPPVNEINVTAQGKARQWQK